MSDTIADMNREQLIDLFVRTMLFNGCVKSERNVAILRRTAEQFGLEALRKCVAKAELAARTPFRLLLSFTCTDCASEGHSPLKYQEVHAYESYDPMQVKPCVGTLTIKHVAHHRAVHPTHAAFHLSNDVAFATIRVRCDACIDPATNQRGHVMTMSSNCAYHMRPGRPLAEKMYDDFVERHSSLHPTHSAMLHLLPSE